jgi:hypothetical protein
MSVAEQRAKQHCCAVTKAGIRKGFAHLEALKGRMDDSLVTNQLGDWNHCILQLSSPIFVASVGAVSPNRDIAEVPLQHLHDSSRPKESLLCSVMPLQGKPPPLSHGSREILRRVASWRACSNSHLKTFHPSLSSLRCRSFIVNHTEQRVVLDRLTHFFDPLNSPFNSKGLSCA